MADFSRKLLRWYDRHGRKDLPWQKDRSAYRVWISEIMLQQTQVGTVIPYFERFMATFPDIHSLASAPLDRVLHLWTGLGYYARARNLHRAAQELVTRYDGDFPSQVEELVTLPGIGRSTAGAIVALAFDQSAPILDGNVKRVLTRFHGIAGWPEQTAVNKQLWELAAQHLPRKRHGDYTQAIMDLGATLCTRSAPQCQNCPLQTDCVAHINDAVPLYPGRKPGAQLPVRRVTMHILQNHAGEVLLERRPPAGIWGGLWSFPESPEQEPVPARLDKQFTLLSQRQLPPLRHSFSHFHLEISPVLSTVEARPNGINEELAWKWYSLRATPEVGLAAPVKKLLGQLAGTIE